MSALYAESSAVLRWLLGASDARSIGETLAGAEHVVASVLTKAEVARTLRRLLALGDLDVAAHDHAWSLLEGAGAHWSFVPMGEPVLERLRQPFPVEPVRTLDAIHLATALRLRDVGVEVVVLSVDERVRKNAEALMFEVVPRMPRPT